MTTHFGPDYQEEVTLVDGTTATLRLVRPDDKELLARGIERLSPESRYRRFLSARTTLTPAELRYLTELDGHDHFALGALIEGEGAGIARFIRLGDTDVAEPAVTVVDHWQGKGLGRILLDRLVAAATERGIRTFRCDVLVTNEAILSLLQEVAPDARIAIDGSIASVELDLHPHPPSPARSPLSRILSLAGQGVLNFLRLIRPAD